MRDRKTDSFKNIIAMERVENKVEARQMKSEVSPATGERVRWRGELCSVLLWTSGVTCGKQEQKILFDDGLRDLILDFRL
jgi:hypothetical protein